MNWEKQVNDFRGGLKIEAPSMAASIIRVAFFGTVAAGKSVTAGVFAIGITPTGDIGWVDAEGRRSGYAIDILADMAVKKYGGDKQQWVNRFKVVHVEPPFNPLKLVAALEVLEDAGCKTIILDGTSEAWDSDGGYLDLKNDEIDRMMEAAKEKDRSMSEAQASSAAAAHVKPWTHGKLVNKVKASKCNMVILFQAKQKYNPKTFKPDAVVTPIQESGLTRTAMLVARVEAQMVNGDPQGGFCTYRGAIDQGTKHTHPALLKILPKDGTQFTFELAESIAAWCNSGNKFAQPKPTDPIKALTAVDVQIDAEIKAVKLEIWNLTEPIHRGSRKALSQSLWDELLMADAETWETLSLKSAKEILQSVKSRLEKQKEVTP